MAEARYKHVKFDFQSALDQLTQDTSWTLSEEQLTGIFRARAAALARRSHREQVERGTLHIRFMVHGVVFGVDLRHVRTITVPHWVTTWFVVIRRLPRSYRRATSWKKRWALRRSNGR